MAETATIKLEDFTGDYVTAIKIRLSGLSENSMGNGCDRRTVRHAMAIKPLEDGRLKREPYEFLCSKVKPKFGTGSCVYTDPETQAKFGSVTCDRCKELVDRLGLSQCQDPAISKMVGW